MKISFWLKLLLPMLLATAASAQERSFNILVGANYPIELGSSGASLSPKGGITVGLDYWAKNKKGDAWSAGVSFNSFRRKGDVTLNGQVFSQDETFEYLNLHGAPLIWLLDKKERWYAEAGGFVNYLLHQETESRGNVTDNTELFQRIYLGLSAGAGVRLGDKSSSKLLIGLRNDLGLMSFGAGPRSLKFNAISLFVGLGI